MAKLPDPDVITDTKFLSTFGAREMEEAAACIVRVCQRRHTWKAQFFMDDMPDEMTRRGLFMLALHGWLEAGYPNGGATVKRSFVERLLEKRK